MGNIIAIGGGDLRSLATEPIDREIIALSGKPRPRALFAPTASGDSAEYCRAFERAYGDAYGCETDILALVDSPPPYAEIAAKIRRADIVYVGGGNTLMMMRLWRRLGVDELLREAHDAGKTLCGVSAGAICWFERGHSDSMSFENPHDWSYISVEGMGLIRGLACPHYDSDTDGVPRRLDFHEMLARERADGVGIAMDDGGALAALGDCFRVISAEPSAGVYVLRVERGEVVERRLPQTEECQPIGELYEFGERRNA